MSEEIDSFAESTDPLDRKVIYKTSTWEQKVKEGHRELSESYDEEEFKELIKELVEDPRYIIRDRTQAEFEDQSIRDMYRDAVINEEYEKVQIVRAIVEFEEPEADLGEVVTSWISSKTGDSTGKGVVYDKKAET